MARIDQFLQALIKGEKCGLAPATRKEKALAELLEKQQQDGGGVTSWNDLQGKPFGEVPRLITVAAGGKKYEITVNGEISWTESTFSFMGGTYLKILDWAVSVDGAKEATVNGEPLVPSYKWYEADYTGDYSYHDEIIIVRSDDTMIINGGDARTFDKGTYVNVAVLERGIIEIPEIAFETIPPEYLPKAAATADAAGETVTGAEFNALLAALREAGYLAQ